eukprot:1079925-Prymnesium_polylepis.1
MRVCVCVTTRSQRGHLRAAALRALRRLQAARAHPALRLRKGVPPPALERDQRDPVPPVRALRPRDDDLHLRVAPLAHAAAGQRGPPRP